MVEVRIHRAPDGLVEQFEARGHAGYAKAGKDIVCSAATAVMFTAIGYAESLYNPENLPEKACYSESDGYLTWKCPEVDAEVRQKLVPVFDAMVLGLRQIRASVGNRYLVVHE